MPNAFWCGVEANDLESACLALVHNEWVLVFKQTIGSLHA
jgi:hypothetical protein